MDPNYKNIIWTKHALVRMRERSIKQSDAWSAFNNPDKSRYAKAKGAWVYYRTYDKERIEVVAKKNEEGSWLILSVWSKSAEARQSKQVEKFSITKFLNNIFGT